MLNNLNQKFYKTLSITLLLFTFSSCSEPDYTLSDGSSGFIEDLQDRWIVVNYWADWCPPCIKEMPELTEFYSDNSKKVTVFAYNYDELDGEDLEEQLLRFKVNIPSILTNPGLLFGWEPPESLPATYFVDTKGNFKKMIIGPQTKESLELILSTLEN